MKFGIIAALKMVFYSLKHLQFVTIFPPHTEKLLSSLQGSSRQ